MSRRVWVAPYELSPIESTVLFYILIGKIDGGILSYHTEGRYLVGVPLGDEPNIHRIELIGFQPTLFISAFLP